MPSHFWNYTLNIFALIAYRNVITGIVAEIEILSRLTGIHLPHCIIGLIDLILSVKSKIQTNSINRLRALYDWITRFNGLCRLDVWKCFYSKTRRPLWKKVAGSDISPGCFIDLYKCYSFLQS